jgi:tRNA(Ile)-lysidine synthase
MPAPAEPAPAADRPVVAVACSGGRDSLALLQVCLRMAAPMGLQVAALHVHHGLQPQADAWAAGVERRCRRWARQGWPVSSHLMRLALSPARGDSLEAVARQARYAALAQLARQAGATLILLGHHRRDQAETVLLQALRGAGAAGLAAMPKVIERDGLVWARPWLDQPRQAIDRYARLRGLRYVDDASNADARHARNRLRLQVWPGLQGAFDGAEPALAQVAAQAADAAAVLDEVGAADLAALDDGRPGLAVAAWRRLSPARQRNVLRLWCAAQSGRPAARSLIERLAAELHERGEACWPATGGRWQGHRGRLLWIAADTGHVGSPSRVEPADAGQASAGRAVDVEAGGRIEGPGLWRLPRWGGVLEVLALPASAPEDLAPGPSAGISLSLLHRLQPRARRGGERLQLGPGRPPRSLKKQFQSADVPAWARHAPLWWAGDQLVYVPGVGLDSRAWAPAGQVRYGLRWHAQAVVVESPLPEPPSVGSAAD